MAFIFNNKETIVALWLSLEVKEISLDEVECLENKYNVNDKLFLDLDSLDLPEESKEVFYHGFLWISDRIPENIRFRMLKFYDYKEFLPDFHEESLFFAAAEWASNNYSFKMKKYSVQKIQKKHSVKFIPDPYELFKNLKRGSVT